MSNKDVQQQRRQLKDISENICIFSPPSTLSLFFRIVQSIAGYRKFYRTCVKTPCLHAVPLPLDRRTVSYRSNIIAIGQTNSIAWIVCLSLHRRFKSQCCAPTKINSGNSYETWPMVEIYWQISILSALRLPPSFFSRPIQILMFGT